MKSTPVTTDIGTPWSMDYAAWRSSYQAASFGSMSGPAGSSSGRRARSISSAWIDQRDGDRVVGAVDDLDLVARLQLALRGDREVGARAPGVQERLLEARHADARLELEAGHARPATRSSTDPIRQRSPMRAPETSTPAVVRFSPNTAGSSSRPTSSLQNAASSLA